ncbi:amine oxidase [Xylaria bambusicola]|uniref:amine oxidase n=1 Tax=Xylaria bambusicola TaxID=326684 RepID=UPI0020073C2A|nr:amine oxidase [Xylaria bambusicola]KAI0518212.1 amine oxidase [Xylaria bambusicola]
MTLSVNFVPRKKVAIVGSGSAGIGALWALNRTHHDVYLYEASDRLGGHTNTVEWKRGKFRTLVDTGFIVLNTATYPNFINFLKKINVPTVATQITFGFSRDKGKFEWASDSLDAIFCQRLNLFSPRMWRLVFDIIRFNKFALDLLREPRNGLDDSCSPEKKLETIGHYLKRHGYSDTFRNDYLIPITAAMWTTNPNICALEFPVVTLVRAMWNHRLLSTVSTRPDWVILENGAKSYVDAVMRGFPPNHLFCKTAVKHLSNNENGQVQLHLENGKTEVYDHVILAVHGDQAFQIIAPSATEEEKAIMSNFRSSENTCVLHSDISLMPKRRNAWSSGNYLTLSSPWTGKDLDQVSLTYNMNIIQHIPRKAFGDVLLTLNPIHEPRAETVQGRFSYSHPIYTPAAVRALEQLPKIQNKRGVSYAGAWTGHGFHEDGFSSGLHVAISHLGARLPFEFIDPTSSHGRQPELSIIDWLLRVIILLIQIFLIDLPDRMFSATKARISARVPTSSPTSQTSPRSMNSLPRIPWRVLRSNASSWACTSCRREIAQARQLPARMARRPISNTTTARQQTAQAPSMDRLREHYRHKNRTTMYYTLSIILGTVAFSYGSVPMYKMICQTTGWGGQPIRAPGHGGSSSDGDQASRLIPVKDARRIRVTFNASVSDVLPWKFVPQQREVRVLPGETALAFYTATNRSDSDIIGVATYSVTPAQVAPYFSKIQCFCFEEQRLNAGETVDMPVFFYLDPDLLDDLNMRGINEVTLSYTFFKAKYDNNGKFKNFPTTSS